MYDFFNLVNKTFGVSAKLPDRAERLRAANQQLRAKLRAPGTISCGALSQISGVPGPAVFGFHDGKDLPADMLEKVSPHILKTAMRFDAASMQFVPDMNAGAVRSDGKLVGSPVTINPYASTPNGAPAPYPSRNSLPPLDSPLPDACEARCICDALGGCDPEKPISARAIRDAMRQGIPWDAADATFINERIAKLMTILRENGALFPHPDPKSAESLYRIEPRGIAWIKRFAG